MNFLLGKEKANTVFSKKYNCTITGDFMIFEINTATCVATLINVSTQFADTHAFVNLVSQVQNILIKYNVQVIHYPASLNDHHKYTAYRTSWSVIQTNNASDICIMECSIRDLAKNFAVRCGMISNYTMMN